VAIVKNKVALVTGAAGGLGSAITQQLVSEGARVVLTDIDRVAGQAMADAVGDEAWFLSHDVTKADDWNQVIAQAGEIFGPVTILVNNAGVGADGVLIENLDELAYRRIIDINQVSVYLGMRAVLPVMKQAGGGSIVNISSIGGLCGAPASLAYVASKFAVNGMTKAAAIEFAPYNIRVNSVHPGFTRTPMVVPTPAAEVKLKPVIQSTPIKRLCEPEEVARMVVFVASDQVNFATGAEFVVDGGRTAAI
jgi:3alpha(or 20beta)-hydroxysteroid dehydrogenase